MEPQTLQRLMLDDALGALTPDVQSLLTDYLKARPEAAEHASLRVLTQTAQEALHDPSVDLPPAMNFRPNPYSLRNRFAVAAFAAAAMILLTFTVRTASLPQTPTRSTLAVAPIPAAPSPSSLG